MDRDEGLSFSVRLAMCPVERERDPSGCRASDLTPELPVIVVLVPAAVLVAFRRRFVFRRWFHRCFAFRRWYRWYNVNRIAFAIFWIALENVVFARCGGYKKAPDFTRAGHSIVQSRLLHSFFCSTGGLQARTFIPRIHHNEVEQDTSG